MAVERSIPFLLVRHNGSLLEGVAAFRLDSILSGSAMPSIQSENRTLPSGADPLDPTVQQRAREGFLTAISSWPSDLSLELHLVFTPSLAVRSRGLLDLSLVLRMVSSSEAEIEEHLLRGCLQLSPLLNVFFTEAEFRPICQKDELLARVFPFKPKKAFSVHRRRECISLTAPLKRSVIGFSAPDATELSDSSVDHLYPWIPSLDDWTRLLNTLAGQLDSTHILIRLCPDAACDENLYRLRATVSSCEGFLSGGGGAQLALSRQAGLLRDLALAELGQVQETAFRLGVFIFSAGLLDVSLINVLGMAITRSNINFNENPPFVGGFATAEVDAAQALIPGYFFQLQPFPLAQAACAFRLPSPPLQEVHGLSVRRAKTAPAQLRSQGAKEEPRFLLGLNEHQGILQEVSVGTQDRLRHAFILGQTGTGKSTLMEGMVLQDIRAGRGVAVIDPHGDMVDSLLGKIPAARIKDVILFDVLDRERPLGFNLLQWESPEERDLVVDELYASIGQIYDLKNVGGPIFESNFRGMLKLLMGAKGNNGFVPTLLEFTLCYQNQDFLNWLKRFAREPMLQDFVAELENTAGEASMRNLSPYVTSKFSRFLHDSTLLRIVGQQRTSFDFEKIMNEGKIFLVKLGKGRFGSTVSGMLANQLVSRFKLAAMKRGDLPPEKRREFFLYVDECHNLPADNFMELLSEARKFRLGLVLATQYMAQIKETVNRTEGLLSAVLGNVGTFLLFRLGQEDAYQIQQAFQPQFQAQDIASLPNWQGYARLQTGADPVPPFSFRTRVDPAPFDSDTARWIRDWSRNHYGMDAQTVDEQISRRRSAWKEQLEF